MGRSMAGLIAAIIVAGGRGTRVGGDIADRNATGDGTSAPAPTPTPPANPLPRQEPVRYTLA